MIAIITTVLQETPERISEELKKIDLLKHIAAPILFFEGEGVGSWKEGSSYTFKLKLFKYIHLGRHEIYVKNLSRTRLETVENGTMATVWNHEIRLEELTNGHCRYTDEIEIQAGALTLFIWTFAHLFYRHRQRKWKKIIQDNFIY
ncbi:MAG: hypothetical protein R6X10_08785 [Desulfobacterales bacterium]